MMFFKLLKYDFANGTVKQYKKYIFSFVFFLSVGLFFRFSRLSSVSLNFGDYVLNVFAGMEKYVPSALEQFKLPIIWICFYLFSCFTVLYYPYNDISDFGKSVLINSGKRSCWFLSKCTWTVISVFIYFLLFMLSQFIICLIFGDSLSSDITHNEAFLYFSVTLMDNEVLQTHIPLLLFVLPVLVNSAICLLQLTLSLVIKPSYSYMVSAAVFVISVYYADPFVIGNYAMAMRTYETAGLNITPVGGIAYCLILSVVSVIVGIIIFNRYDILNKE